MTAQHPDYYNNPKGNELDSFYDQDYVILQQYGSPIPATYDDAKAIMALFPPQTQFCYYITTCDIIGNELDYAIQTAVKIRDEKGGLYIPLGHLLYGVVTGIEKMNQSSLSYEYSSFINEDRLHPNYLTGYLTALMTYCTITGRSAVGISYDFVSKSKNYYPSTTSNFDQILTSDADMKALQALIDKYVAMFNP
jgi:hypothetical protein